MGLQMKERKRFLIRKCREQQKKLFALKTELLRDLEALVLEFSETPWANKGIKVVEFKKKGYSLQYCPGSDVDENDFYRRDLETLEITQVVSLRVDEMISLLAAFTKLV